MNRVKVWAEVCPLYGGAIHRTLKRLMTFRPSYVDLVEDWMDADVIVESVIGSPYRKNLVHPNEAQWSDEVITRMECFDGDLFYIAHCSVIDDEFFREAFDKSKMVFGFLDLADTVDSNYEYFRMPWGVDTPMFYDRKLDGGDAYSRPYLIYTWGCASNPESEGIQLIYNTIKKLNGNGQQFKMLHSGVDYKFGEGYEYVPPTTDLTEVAVRLSQAKYANALREDEGFELMGLEGMLCGARPIYYDIECYHDWFDNFGLFISEVPDIAEDQLYDIFLGEEMVGVEPEEKYYVINNFRWRTIADDFWAKVLS